MPVADRVSHACRGAGSWRQAIEGAVGIECICAVGVDCEQAAVGAGNGRADIAGYAFDRRNRQRIMLDVGIVR